MSQSTGNYLLNKSKVRLGESELGGKTLTSTHESSQIFELPTSTNSPPVGLSVFSQVGSRWEQKCHHRLIIN